MTEEESAASENGEKRRVLVVDDEKDFVLNLEDILISRGYQVGKAFNTKGALEKIKAFDAQVALLDIRLGRSSGLDLIGKLRAVRPGILVVMMTAYAATDTAIGALQQGAYDYLRKPLSANDLLLTLDRCFDKLKLEKEKAVAEDALTIRNKELEEINARLRNIVDSTKGLAACSRIQELAPLLLEEFARNMAAQGGSLYLREGDVLVLKHSLDTKHAPDTIAFPLKKGSIFEQVISNAEPILIQNLKKEESLYPSGWDGYKDGSLLVFPFPDETGEIIGVISLHNKIEPPFTSQDKELGTILASYSCETLRATRAMEELRESENRYRLIAEHASDFIWTTDLDTRYTYVSPSAERLFGYTSDELVGQDVNKVVAPESLDVAMNILKEELAFEESAQRDRPRSRVLDMKIICKDGSSVWTENQMNFLRDEGKNVIGIVGVTRNIDERRGLETQLRQAQKMEAIGTLAGGIAHDFNNILSAMIGYTEIASIKIFEGKNALGALNEVLKASERAKDLVSQILSFSRQADQERKPVQVSHIVEETIKLLRASFPATIEIRSHIESDTHFIEANSTQIHQVLMNLGTNAHHAMRDKGGVLEVTLAPVELGVDKISAYPDLEPGPYLKFSVVDNGHGMNRETVERVFDPYFTTKEKGEGTGLGLSIVHGIVKSHGGAITVESEPEKGTSIYIYLPQITEVNKDPENRTFDPLPTGNERILYIDDEKVLLKIGKEMLEYLGYEVVTRTNGIKALELFRTEPDRFDLIISDMTMPKMTGDTLAKEFMQVRPDIPVIICTGYSELMTREKAMAIGIRDYIMKPLVMNELAKKIREILDQN